MEKVGICRLTVSKHATGGCGWRVIPSHGGLKVPSLPRHINVGLVDIDSPQYPVFSIQFLRLRNVLAMFIEKRKKKLENLELILENAFLRACQSVNY